MYWEGNGLRQCRGVMTTPNQSCQPSDSSPTPSNPQASILCSYISSELSILASILLPPTHTGASYNITTAKLTDASYPAWATSRYYVNVEWKVTGEPTQYLVRWCDWPAMVMTSLPIRCHTHEYWLKMYQTLGRLPRYLKTCTFYILILCYAIREKCSFCWQSFA